MFEAKVIGLLIVLRSIFCGCGVEPKSTGFKKSGEKYSIRSVSRLPKGFLESSGLARSENDGIFYTHKDGGSENHLYKITLEGELLDTIEIKDAKNKDWEDLTKDEQGNFYVGDFGNNFNRRKDLKVYKVSSDFSKVETISFSFNDQKEYPPQKKEQNFDVEGFFWKDGNLHLFSKNRGTKCLNHYTFPDQPGGYNVSPTQSLFVNGMVTAADISPDGKLMALLSYGKIYLFEISEKGGFLSNPINCIPFTKGAQSEGLVFINNTDFLISNETGKLFIGRKK